MAAHVVEVLISSRPNQLPFAAVKDGSLTDATSILKRAYLARKPRLYGRGDGAPLRTATAIQCTRLEAGLQFTDEQRPPLILGEELRRFHLTRRASRKPDP